MPAEVIVTTPQGPGDTAPGGEGISFSPGRGAGSASTSAVRRLHLQVACTWAAFGVLLLGLLSSLGLQYGLIAQKLPFLLGLRLSPDGFLQGAALSLFVTALSLVFACLVGALTAVGRLSRHPVAFAAATFYGSLFRGTPLLVQVLLIYLALPQVGIVLGALSSGVIALSLNYGSDRAAAPRSA